MSGACSSSTKIHSCGDHGVCIQPTSGSALCICGHGYVQDATSITSACQPYDACQINNICVNGGVCSQAAPPTLFKCDCKPLYSGKRCEKFDNPCEVKLCRNGAECIYMPTAATNFMCLCPVGYSGSLCETAISYGIGGVGKPVSGLTLVLMWAIVAVCGLLGLYCLIMALIETIQERMKRMVRGAFGLGAPEKKGSGEASK